MPTSRPVATPRISVTANDSATRVRLRPALRAGGKVGIIDKNGNGQNHGVNHEVVEREMAEAGFRLASTYDFTKADGQDYFLIFVAK